MPTVSVIVTTYNRKEYLTETIQSILDQTYQDFELIVVDNYSNYDFLALIKSFNNENIIPFQNQNNGIIAVNRNFGIKQAKGEFIAFCDDDDLWVKEKLQLQVNILNETKCDLVYSNMILFETDIMSIIKKTSNKKINTLKDLINKNQINTSSVLVRNKEIFFSEDPQLIAIEDYALWVDLCIKGYSFEFLNQHLIYFRISKKNESSKTWVTKHLKLIYLHISLLINNPNLPIKIQIIKKITQNYLKFLIKYTIKKQNKS